MSRDELLIDFGLQPVSNRFRYSNDEEIQKFPLSLSVSKESGLIRIKKPFPISEIKPRFDWLTCFEPEDHLDNLVSEIIKLPGISKNSVFGGFSFKDDTTLNRLAKLGFNKTWRINPQSDLDLNDECFSIETLQGVFKTDVAKNINKKHGCVDVFIARHVIEHAYDIDEFINAAKELINPDGYIVWEIPDCERTLSALDFTAIWEEHIYYFTRFTFKYLLESSGFKLFSYVTISYPLENSIIAITTLNKKPAPPQIVEEEVLTEIYRAKNFAKSLNNKREIIRKKLEYLVDTNRPIVLFGAGHHSVAFLSIMNISDLVRFVIDDNENKKNMWLPIENMQIKGSDYLYSENIGVCLLSLNPQNHHKVITNNECYSDKGGVFASIFPGRKSYLEEIN